MHVCISNLTLNFRIGIFIKIKNGAVEVYGVAGRSIKAVEDAVSAIKTILAAGEALKGKSDQVFFCVY